MSNKTYRVAMVGLSGIASGVPSQSLPGPLGRELTTSHAACLALMPNIDVVGYCDLVQDMLDNFGDAWSNLWPQAKPYTDYKQMIADTKPDILTVATGDNRHAEIVVDGANNSVKGIFCEKPLATSMEDANRMLTACQNNNVVLSIGHTRRWRQLYYRIKQAIDEDAIGKLNTIIASQRGPRAMMFRNGTHILDGICFFAGDEPAQVVAKLEDGFDDWDQYRGDGGKRPENDPSASGLIMFKNGVRAFYNANKKSFPSTSTLTLQGEKGEINFELNSVSATLTSSMGINGEAGTTELVPADYQATHYVAGYEEMIRLIERGGGKSAGPGEEARWVVQILTGFLKSHQMGSRLVDVPQ